MIRCLIIDDEPIARDILRQYVIDTPTLSLVGECEDAVSALSILKDQPVDLIILDVNMPKLSGISFLKTLANPPKVILSTAYSEYALEGYELDIVDYLLKPFPFERFLKAINKVSASFVEESPSMIIKESGKTYRILESDILFVESMGDYLTLHCIQKKYTFNRTLKSFTEELSSNEFVRVHKSYTVSISNIDFVEGNLIHIGKSQIPIGNAFKDSFLSLFGK